jgi:hypothetical protein
MVVLFGLLSPGCGRKEPKVRSYREINIVPEHPAAMAATPVPTAASTLTWTTPASWTEQGASQMRLVTFKVGSEGAECTITIFPGDVGGLEANLRRWLGQLRVQVADAEVTKFSRAPETFQTEGGLPCLVYDFGSLLPADKPDSLLAAVVPLDGSTAFVKFTASRNLLVAEKANFMALCRSLKP